MPVRQTVPALWLVSDQRNDAALERALARLLRGARTKSAGLIFRHYHLPPAARAARFRTLARIVGSQGLWTAWAGPAREARRHGADACYGPAAMLARGPALPRLVTSHSLAEIGAAARARASAILLSPVLPTRSHPGSATLGPLRFRLLAARSPVPVIALGGMDRRRARMFAGFGWAAIDGLATGG